MDGLEAESGPATDNAGQSSPSDSHASLDKALGDALAKLPDDKVPSFGEEEISSIPETEAAEPPSEAEPETKADSQQAAPEAPKEPQAGIPEAPQHWPQARREAFAKLDTGAKQVFLDLDKDWNRGFTQKTQELAEHRKVTQALYGMFTDADRSELQARGMSELDLLSTYRQLDNLYRTNPVQYVKQVIELAGLKPEQVFPTHAGQAQPQAEEWVDPDIQAVRSEVGVLNSQIQAWQRQAQEQQRQAQLHEQHGRLQMIQQFATEADDGGNPRFPHFASVQEQMAIIMQSDPRLATMPPSREKLAAAYDLAVYAHPDIRNAAIEADIAKRLADKEKAANALKLQAASTPKPKPGSPSLTAPAPQGLDAIIAQAMRGKGL